ncbi:MAG: 4Fe-4S dicluster domain-containing protein [Deltaproteobacteria bacterium]|jgi:adenylylsulfate reductase subunit B|nr:4Fe-4S dicluster domain-containing protein [Deltaproteobacteria bacterium]
MGIVVDDCKCIVCGRCAEICPGGLIVIDKLEGLDSQDNHDNHDSQDSQVGSQSQGGRVSRSSQVNQVNHEDPVESLKQAKLVNLLNPAKLKSPLKNVIPLRSQMAKTKSPKYNGSARLTAPERCWSCASCLKECPTQAITMYLSPALGGSGAGLTAFVHEGRVIWRFKFPDGLERKIAVNRQIADPY